MEHTNSQSSFIKRTAFKISKEIAIFLLKQRDSTVYNEKLESVCVKAHYITKKKGRYKRIK